MRDLQAILASRLSVVAKHDQALGQYYAAIKELESQTDVYNAEIFNTLQIEKRALLEAYLKRFSSLQDYLGAKLFPIMLDVAGIGSQKMSEVLVIVEQEGIVSDFSTWMELRTLRNDLEHDYTNKAVLNLSLFNKAMNAKEVLKGFIFNSIDFISRYVDDNFKLQFKGLFV